MEGRETDLEYNLLMGLTGASVSKHLLDEHFTLLWANDFYYDMIGYPKEEYEALFHNKPDLYFKGYDEAWNILSKNVYETIANKASGYETVIQMPTRKGKRWTKITSTFTDQLQDGIPISSLMIISPASYPSIKYIKTAVLHCWRQMINIWTSLVSIKILFYLSVLSPV